MHLGELKFKQRGREEQAEPDGTEVGVSFKCIIYFFNENAQENVQVSSIFQHI